MRKFLVALIPVCIAALNTAMRALSERGAVTVVDLMAILISALTALGVYLVPNATPDEAYEADSTSTL